MNQKYIAGIKDIITKYDHFIFDMDGVIWVGDTAIQKGIDAVNMLIQSKKNVYFFTNNSTKSKSTYQQRLKQYGIEVCATKVYSSSYLAALYCQQKLNIKKAYVIGMQGIVDELENHSISYISPTIHKENVEINYDSEMEIDKDVDAVVVGLDQYFNYRKLFYGQRYIMDNNAKFIGTNSDRVYPVKGKLAPGGGTLVRILEIACGQNAIMIGKPERIGYDLIKEEQKIEDDSKVVMIGDNVETDIEFAKNSGIDSVLVMTGVCKDDKLGVNATYIAKEL